MNWILTDEEITKILQTQPFTFDRNKNCGWVVKEEAIIKLLQAQVAKIQGVTDEQLRQAVAEWLLMDSTGCKWEEAPKNWHDIYKHKADTIIALVAPVIRAQAESYKQALEEDASDLWRVTNAIKKEIASREWIMEGRGCYAWDDDRYRDETRLAFESVLKLISEVQHPAQLRFHKTMDDSLKAEEG